MFFCPLKTHKHAAAKHMHQPIRSLPLPALQSSSYRQADSSDICNIYIFPVMLQVTRVTLKRVARFETVKPEETEL